MRKIHKSRLGNLFSDTDVGLIGRLSFEDRSTTIYKEILKKNSIVYSHFFSSQNESKEALSVRNSARIKSNEITKIIVKL